MKWASGDPTITSERRSILTFADAACETLLQLRLAHPPVATAVLVAFGVRSLAMLRAVAALRDRRQVTQTSGGERENGQAKDQPQSLSHCARPVHGAISCLPKSDVNGRLVILIADETPPRSVTISSACPSRPPSKKDDCGTASERARTVNLLQ